MYVRKTFKLSNTPKQGEDSEDEERADREAGDDGLWKMVAESSFLTSTVV